MNTVEKLEKLKAGMLQAVTEKKKMREEEEKKNKKKSKYPDKKTGCKESVKEEKVNEDYSYNSPYDWEKLEAGVMADLTDEEKTELEEMDDYDQKKVIWLIYAQGMSMEEAIDSKDDANFYEDQSIEDVAQDLRDEGSLSDDFLIQFIDWERVARDLEIGDNFNYTTIGTFHTPF